MNKLIERWWLTHRSLLSEAGFKPPQAAGVKSIGSERWGKDNPRDYQVWYREASESESMFKASLYGLSAY